MFPRFVAIEVLSMALGLLAGAELAAAHMNYDENPAASASCGGNDCRPVEVDAVQWDDEKKGWHVNWDGDSVFVPHVSALPSPDDGFHGCGNRTRGLFGAT